LESLPALLSCVKYSNGWTATFLITTAANSVTGFLFPFHKFLPSHAVGVVSLFVLAVTIPLYIFHQAGPRRRTYVIGSVKALYLNVFLLIAQFFVKIPALKALAPTESEPRSSDAGGGHADFHCPWVSRCQALFRGNPPRSLTALSTLEGFLYPPCQP
jgi:hypothetical protein